MNRFPKYKPWRPDFMAPSPRVTIENNLWALEHQVPQWAAEEDSDPVSELDPDVRGYRYYTSTNVLGKLYRAIDEKKFLAELQRQRRGLDVNDHPNQSLIHRLWAHVQLQTSLVQWKHHIEWAREVKEA
jgi:hypothetical protein